MVGDAGEVEYRSVESSKSVCYAIRKCCHCGTHWEVRPGSGNRRGHCRNCMGHLCSDKCAERCLPYEKQLDEIRKEIERGIQG